MDQNEINRSWSEGSDVYDRVIRDELNSFRTTPVFEICAVK